MKRLIVMVVLAVLFSLLRTAVTKPAPKYPTVDEKELKGVVRTNYDSPAPTKSQVERRNKSNAIVKGLGLPCLENLPVVEDESSIQPRTADEIAKRCVAVAICSVKGETNVPAIVRDVTMQFSAATFFSPKEKRFIDNPSASKQDLLNYTWQYERVHVLLWALGYVDELKPPGEMSDVPNEMKILKGKTLATLISGAKPRPMAEILDQADLYYRLHWAAIELRLKSKSSEKASEEIIVERHHALNWLIRYMKQEWDDVQTDT